MKCLQICHISPLRMTSWPAAWTPVRTTFALLCAQNSSLVCWPLWADKQFTSRMDCSASWPITSCKRHLKSLTDWKEDAFTFNTRVTPPFITWPHSTAIRTHPLRPSSWLWHLERLKPLGLNGWPGDWVSLPRSRSAPRTSWSNGGLTGMINKQN